MSGKYLLFRVAKKHFAIKLKLIKEVILFREVESIPKMPQSIKGIINLRGQVIPIIHFASLLQIDEHTQDKPNLIIIDSGGEKDFGFEADEIVEVIKIDEKLMGHTIESDEVQKHFTYSVVTNHENHSDKLIYVLKDQFSIDFSGQDLDKEAS
jgi:purine-binding chemotaxis protein CheW